MSAAAVRESMWRLDACGEVTQTRQAPRQAPRQTATTASRAGS